MTIMVLLAGPNLTTFIQAGRAALQPGMILVPGCNNASFWNAFEKPIPRFLISAPVTAGRWSAFRERIGHNCCALVDESDSKAPRIRALAAAEENIKKMDKKGTIRGFSFWSIDATSRGRDNEALDNPMTGVDPVSAGLFALLHGGRLPTSNEWYWAKFNGMETTIPEWEMDSYRFEPPPPTSSWKAGATWAVVEDPVKDWRYPVLEGVPNAYPPSYRSDPFAGDVGFRVVMRPPSKENAVED